MKKISLVALMMVGLASNTLAANFTDVSDSHIYSREIQYIKDKGISVGFSDGRYKPEDPITRSAITKLVIASEYTQSEIDGCIDQNPFSDVNSTSKFVKFICLAKKEGIVHGYGDGSYKPENSVTFSEAAKIILNTIDHESFIGSVRLEDFTDKLQEKNAYPPTISIGNFSKPVTRGEVAFLIRTAMEDYNILPEIPKSTYEVMVKRGETKTVTETGLSFRMNNHGIKCSSGGYTFIDVNVTKNGQTQLLHLQRTCTGIGDGGTIQGISTAEADAFGYHFVLAQVIERVAYQADTFEYYIQFK